MAFEEERKVACPEVVSQKATTSSEEVVEACENLSGIEEKVIHICEPEVGRNLSDEEEMRSARDLMNCQEGRDKF
jgi:hypothetical protein